MYDFAFHKPSSVADAVQALAADGEAKALAGGQTFIPVLKQRLNKPSAIIDLHGLGLTGITAAADKITIGAMTTHGAIMADPGIQARIPGLAKMASWIGDTQVRHRGTIGGSLANNDPSACYPAAVLALGATIVTDKRRIPADDVLPGHVHHRAGAGRADHRGRVPDPGEVQLREVPQPGLALRHGRRVRRPRPGGRAGGDHRRRRRTACSATRRWSRR